MVPVGAEGVPTTGITVTLVEAPAEGPLQPLAVTDTVAVPVKAGPHVTTPKTASIVPALAGLNDQLYEVASLAVVV